MRRTTRLAGNLWIAAIALGSMTALHAQTMPPNFPTKEELARNNKRFLELASKSLRMPARRSVANSRHLRPLQR